MAVNKLDAQMLAKMFLSGAKTLESKKDIINELNVFPVPDGDTGTNMTLTIMSAAKDVNSLENPDMKTLCKSISSGSLRGARGNSGVILSQLLRGFTKVIRDYDELDVAIITAGFDKAVESAYKAVMKPKEGTILTVAKGACDKANQLYSDGVEDIEEFMKGIIEESNVVLQKTPDMLPVLKEAGVVDSGGQGLVEFLTGAYNAFIGQGMEFSMDTETQKVAGETRMLSAEPAGDNETEYTYSVSYTILLNGKLFNVKHENDFKFYLENIGADVNVTVNENQDCVLVSLKSNDPGLAIQKGIKFGLLTDVKIDNLSINAKEETVVKAPVGEKKKFGFVSVAAGAGLADIFRNLGVDYVIEGGQTMNPSTEDVLNAISTINAETVYVLPNNKNIIMAANQARDLTEDKNVIVIPTKTIPQGISALISFSTEVSADENASAMTEQIGMVKTGQVTYAVRDTVIEGTEIHQDDYMGIGDSGILSNGKDIKEVITGMLDKMVDDTTELISIYYGSDVSESNASEIQSLIAEKYSGCDIEFQPGGQPVYYYIISAE